MAAAVFGGSRLGSPKSRFLPNYYQFPQPCERLVTTDEGVRFLAGVGTLLKIDTEGFELEVLSGSRRVLEESRPAIFIELSEDNLLAQASSTVDVISFLMDRGYRVREAVSGESMGLEADYAGCHCDAIALAVESADTPDSAL